PQPPAGEREGVAGRAGNPRPRAPPAARRRRGLPPAPPAEPAARDARSQGAARNRGGRFARRLPCGPDPAREGSPEEVARALTPKERRIADGPPLSDRPVRLGEDRSHRRRARSPRRPDRQSAGQAPRSGGRPERGTAQYSVQG